MHFLVNTAALKRKCLKQKPGSNKNSSTGMSYTGNILVVRVGKKNYGV